MMAACKEGSRKKPMLKTLSAATVFLAVTLMAQAQSAPVSFDPAAKIFNILAAQAGEKIPRMADYDIAVKSGKLDYEEVLLDLAIS